MGGDVLRRSLNQIRKTTKVYSNSEHSSTDVRLVDLATGEVSHGYLTMSEGGALLDGGLGARLFPPAQPQRTDERFLSEEGGRQAPAENGLVMSAIVARKVHRLSVFADVCKVEREKPALTERKNWAGQGSQRGKVKGFAARPRRRMMERLGKIRTLQGALFMTLTLPDAAIVFQDYHDQRVLADYAKDALRRFEKRLFRRFKLAGYVWRIEFQPRKSGALPGIPVPHFHLLVFGVSGRLALLRKWVSLAWFQAVGSADENHLRAGTNVREITSRRHMVNYVSKYIGKEEHDDYEAGNRWGARGEVDMSASVEVDISESELVAFKRLLRGWLKGRGSRRYAERLRKMPAAFGCVVLGLGDSSQPFGAAGATIIRMLEMIGVLDGQTRQTCQVVG